MGLQHFHFALVGRNTILHAPHFFWFPIGISISLHTSQHSSQMPIVCVETHCDSNIPRCQVCVSHLTICEYFSKLLGTYVLVSMPNNRKTVNSTSSPEDSHMPRVYKNLIDAMHSELDFFGATEVLRAFPMAAHRNTNQSNLLSWSPSLLIPAIGYCGKTRPQKTSLGMNLERKEEKNVSVIAHSQIWKNSTGLDHTNWLMATPQKPERAGFHSGILIKVFQKTWERGYDFEQ